MSAPPLEALFQIAISAVFGALASVSQLLASAKILTHRRIAASMLGGVTGGVASGAIFGASFPDLSANYLLVAGIGSVGGVAGVHAIVAYFFAKHAPEILAKQHGIDDISRLFDTGEYTDAEIAAMIAQVSAEMRRNKERDHSQLYPRTKIPGVSKQRDSQ